MRFYFFVFLLFPSLAYAHGGPDLVVVSNTKDSGPESLRQAISWANDDSETVVAFQIPTTDTGYNKKTGVFTINLRSPLPAVEAEGTIFDGLAQTFVNNSNKSGPEIQISGKNAGKGAIGLQIRASECGLRGLILSDFSGPALILSGQNAQKCRIQSNLLTRNGVGVVVEKGATKNWIGAAPRREKAQNEDFAENYAKDQSNAIWNNNGDAIFVGAGSEENSLRGNRFGFNNGQPIRFEKDVPAAPKLEFARDKHAPNHILIVSFQTQPGAEVVLDLLYFRAELRGGLTARLPFAGSTETKIFASQTLKADETGKVVWNVPFPNYPVGSWAVQATTDGQSGPLSEIKVMPWLT